MLAVAGSFGVGLAGVGAAGGSAAVRAALAMVAGLTVVYVGGLAWLATFVPAPKLLAAGFTPFILGDLVKIALASGLIAAVTRLKGRAQ